MAAPLTPAGAPEFLERAGWGGAELRALPGDASFRRYFRVRAGGRQALLMDAPPPAEDPRPFIAIARHLTGHGFRVPAVLAAEPERGLVLVEDLGEARMRETLEQHPEREAAVYGDAIDLLLRLADVPLPAVPPYDEATLQREAALLPEWFCPALGLSVDLDGYARAWRAALARMEAAPPVLVLRDYHAENIMLLPDGALGLLDFQDALIGHPAYDLASLLQDARRDVNPALEAAMLARWRARGGVALDIAYHVLAAQRNAKIVGIFTRLWQRDGKPRYLELLPRVWAYLERDLAHPALAEVRAWFDANVPAAARRQRPR